MTDLSSISNRELANICRVVRRQRKDRGLTLEAMARETRVPLTILRAQNLYGAAFVPALPLFSNGPGALVFGGMKRPFRFRGIRWFVQLDGGIGQEYGGFHTRTHGNFTAADRGFITTNWR